MGRYSKWPYGPYLDDSSSPSSNRFGSDLSNSDMNDQRFLEEDYSIGGGVTMRRSDIDHGFPKRPTGHSGKGPRNWMKSDETIHHEACEALYAAPEVDAGDVEVSVKDGEVYLKGWVDDRDSKKAAERCVEMITGVKDVFNELHLRNRKMSEGTSIASKFQ